MTYCFNKVSIEKSNMCSIYWRIFVSICKRYS